MKRRDNIKWLVAGGIGATLLTGESSCKNEKIEKKTDSKIGLYGRTEEELIHDQKVSEEKFFTEEEMKMITVLSEIIIPKDETSAGAIEAGVPAFIEFIVKDMKQHQLPMRGGLNWLNHQCNSQYNQDFVSCSTSEKLKIIDTIAYPDKASEDKMQGVKFFNLLRNLVVTGFYTSEIGLNDIGYKGNIPNVWDGVPTEVLNKHGLDYDEKYKEVYLKPEERNEVMIWE